MSRFREYLEDAAGEDRARIVLDALESQASVSLRLGPKFSHDREDPAAAADGYFGMATAAVPWGGAYCRLLPERPSFTLDPLFHAGAYYVQDSSAMFVAEAAFRQYCPDGPLRVLDLCAAPGGKSTGLLQVLEGRAEPYLLVANEVMKNRAAVLADNIARWGDPSAVVTSADPAAFAALEGWFDVIVADVPCSGEGMFRKDAQAREQWSPDNVALCQARSRRIVADVWPSLRDGGLLVYSTCTFNRMENDGNVQWFAEELGAEILPVSHVPEVLDTGHGCLLLPGYVPGEGQYCAVLRKRGGVSSPVRGRVREDRTLSRWKELWKGDCVLRRRGETLVADTPYVAAALQDLSFLRPLASGTALGVMKGKDFVPDADLALSLGARDDVFPYAGLDRETALAFLHRDAISLPDAPRGIVMLRYKDVPLGFVKNLGTRCNNLLPPGRRIRMDI